MSISYRVTFPDPSNVSMGAPLLSPVEIEGLSWIPSQIKDGYFHFNIFAISGPWIALAKADVFMRSVNFAVYLMDTENKKVFTSKVFNSVPSRIEILGDKQVQVELNDMGFKTNAVVSDWQEI